MSFHKYFVTTAIPYVNSKPHIGHAQEFIVADAIARFYKNKGRDVVLQSGSDDNATKNVLVAKQMGLSTKEFVDLNSAKFQDLLRALNIQPDFFIRTSSENHQSKVQSFIEKLHLDDIFESDYTGLYCSGCEDFYDERDLANGLCPDHLKKPEAVSESNRFFRLSKYQDKIFELIDSDKIKITPATKKREILSFVRRGLSDISLSRSALRTHGWGIPYPGSTEQTVYVWIDALINYISAAPQLWSEEVYKIHVIGKNVWKFHAIYWPALLLSAGLPLPNEIVIHGFLTNEGIKISKSLGNGVDPFEVVDRYGADALRFYLLAVLSFEQDADFVEANLLSSYNSELANKLGNLASRILSLAKGLDLVSPTQKIFVASDFYKLREDSFNKINSLNAEINDIKPWELLKKDQTSKFTVYLNQWLLELRQIALILEPVIPEGAKKLLQNIELRSETIVPLYPRK